MSRSAAARKLSVDPAELRLAARARAGDRQAMIELYRAHRGPLFRHAYRMLGNEAAAHDVVQESFARALAAIDRTREELRFKAWIFRIATNLCLRQLTVRARWTSADGQPETPAAGKAGDPEGVRRRREIARFVAEALESTPSHYRQLLLLREIEELSYEELAQVLETTVPRIKVSLHRARSRFSAEFVAARLLADPSAAEQLKCGELAALLEAHQGGDPARARREIVRHLERCKICRQRDRRPTGELFALLPALPALPDTALPPALPAPPPAPLAATIGGSLALKGALVGLGATAIIAAFVFTGTDRRRPARRSVTRTTTKASVERPPAPRTAVTPRPTPAAQVPLPASSALVLPPASSRAGTTGRSLAKRPGKRSAKRRRVAVKGPSWQPRRLALRVSLSATKVWVERKGKRFELRMARELRIGDVLRATPGRSFGLQLPGDQWLGVSGALRLDAVPRLGEGRMRIAVTLLSGGLRGKATARGGGLRIAVGARRIEVDHGALRLRRDARGRVRLETLKGTYASVTAPPSKAAPDGLARSVAPQSGVTFSGEGDAGSSRGLLAAPSGLRPLSSKHTTPPLLSWKAISGASGYVVELSHDTDFVEVVRAYRSKGTSLRPSGLAPGAYYWQVLATDGAHRGRPSKIYRFVVLDRD